jgi:predicted ferric reductase
MMMKEKNLTPRQNENSSLVKYASRNFFFLLAFLLALFPSVIKMYETSHWFREGDPSVYDNAIDWFSNPAVPFQSHFDSAKVLMRVYFFIVPYILSALLVSIALLIPLSLPATIHHDQRPRRMAGSVIRRTFAFPSFLTRVGLPHRVSMGELLGIAAFLILNVGTIFVRVHRSLPRGSRKITFLVDEDDVASREPINPFSWQACEVWAKTLGVIAILNLGWYLLLPIGRKSVLLEAVGVSWERAVKYHRWVGYYTVLIIVIHSILYLFIWIHGDGNPKYDPEGKMIQQNIVPWYCSKNDCDEAQARQLRVNIYGFLTILFIGIMTVFSIPWIRRHKFEWFYYTHHLFIFVFLFICLHYKGAIIYIIPGIAVYAVDKLMALVSYLKTAPAKTRMLSSTVVEISFEIRQDVTYEAGDYIFLNVPEVSFLEWHPFSLTSAPSVDGNKVFFHLKDSGSWTKKVIMAAAKKDNATLNVRLDGFYGANDVHKQLQNKDGVVLVGGGIGVTPMISLALEMCQTNTIPVTLFWVVRTIEEFGIFSSELVEAQRRYKHLKVKVWITLSLPESGDTDGRLLKSELLELNDFDQVEYVLRSVTPLKQADKLVDQKPSRSYVFRMNEPGIQGAFNAMVMCFSMVLALIAFAFTAKMFQIEKYSSVVQDKISLVELCMVCSFVIIWIGLVILIVRPLADYYVQKFKPTDENIGIDATVPVLEMTAQQSNKSSYKSEEEDTEDVEAKTEHKILQSLIVENVGLRPDFAIEFGSFAQKVLKINALASTGSTVEIGVLACGPSQMVKSINSICNVPSISRSWLLERDQQVYFSFTEEDWEW